MAAVETMMSLGVPACLFLTIIILLYMFGTWTLSTWTQVGITGPPPSPFVGNMKELSRKGVFACLLDWNKLYGKTYGAYFFRRPVLLTSDLEIMKEVFIKNFKNFTARGNLQPLQPDLVYRSVLLAEGDVWRRQRHTMTPTFSASKLKHMNKMMAGCCTNLVNSIQKSTLAKAPLDVKETFGCFTLDVIARTGFGFETNCLDDGNNEFLDNVRNVVGFSTQFSLPGFVASIFPILEPLMKRVGLGTGSRMMHFDFVCRTILAAINERKNETGHHRADVLQLLLDAEATEEEIKKNPDQKCLSTEEIIAQGIILFFAGYETTATTLQYLSYVLALNPEKQEKLHNEIVAAIGKDEPSYENVTQISYLDSCIREAMRCFPPVPMCGRKAIETCTVEGVTIPAGSSVMVAIYALMRDEEIFPEPEKFIPERFEKNSPYPSVPTIAKELTFGIGPRQCIGMRLALYEAKMAAVAVIRKFKFVKVKETPEVISFVASALSKPTTSILVGTELRE